ncbi:hypothetical protein CDAR_255431 [Caerostris darwini]|uniref:Uncharacterized protein n=1 Tax=Caerostris darwini TaxID=1538125 RepID=A0AAV4UM09_9ARAC|nr:hypothetical protein CDAR_255431 [Caerostris darwini]
MPKWSAPDIHSENPDVLEVNSIPVGLSTTSPSIFKCLRYEKTANPAVFLRPLFVYVPFFFFSTQKYMGREIERGKSCHPVEMVIKKFIRKCFR